MRFDAAASNSLCSASRSTGAGALPWHFAHEVVSMRQVWLVLVPVRPAGNVFMWQPAQLSATARCGDGVLATKNAFLPATTSPWLASWGAPTEVAGVAPGKSLL